jgi:CxxC motif-containing protein (DUF1111 family)
MQRAQKKRSDAIKGVPNRVWDAFAEKHVIGRFNWKANGGSLAHQTANAFVSDMGITSTRFPDEPCMPSQRDCLAAPRGNHGSKPEIDDETLANVIFFQAMLAPPARRNMNDQERTRRRALVRTRTMRGLPSTFLRNRRIDVSAVFEWDPRESENISVYRSAPA